MRHLQARNASGNILVGVFKKVVLVRSHVLIAIMIVLSMTSFLSTCWSHHHHHHPSNLLLQHQQHRNHYEKQQPGQEGMKKPYHQRQRSSRRKIRRTRKLQSFLASSLRNLGSWCSSANRHHRQQQQEPSSTQPLLVHFLHTTNESTFFPHNLRAMESVLYHHPTAYLVLHVPKGIDMTERPLLPLMKRGYNVTFERYDIYQLLDATQSYLTTRQDDEDDDDANNKNNRRSTNGTSTTIIDLIDSWRQNMIEYSQISEHWYVDVTDLVRLLLLYLYGGVYLDTDVIVVKPLVPDDDKGDNPMDLPNNVVAWEDDKKDTANGAVMKFLHPYNRFLLDCIQEYLATYQPNNWGYNGPQLITRVFRRSYSSCELSTDEIWPPKQHTYGLLSTLWMKRSNRRKTLDDDDVCPVHMLPRKAFYPFEWMMIREVCFQRKKHVRF